METEVKKFRHRKTRLVVAWGIGSERYISTDAKYYLPKDVVEDSTEWEEITPLFDFFGVPVTEDELHYRIVLDVKGTTNVLNGKGGLWPDHAKNMSRVLGIFKDYGQACQFQRIFVALVKEKELLVTAGGNPSTYLKNLLKAL